LRWRGTTPDNIRPIATSANRKTDAAIVGAGMLAPVRLQIKEQQVIGV
jgi:hypothetical protein